MKKHFIFIAIIFCSLSSSAQDVGLPPRAYKQAELDRWSQVCGWLSSALPSTYKDYTVRHLKCGAFEWAEINKDMKPLTVIDKKGIPIGNNPYYRIWFDMNEDTATDIYNHIMVGILEAKKDDGTMDMQKVREVGLAETKFNQTKTVLIEVRTNVKVDFSKQYYVPGKPEKINLPINAFGYYYWVPSGKTLLNEDGEEFGGTDGQEFYKDKALVFITSKPPKVEVTKYGSKSTMQEDKVFPQDNAPFTSLTPIVNISVEIYGAEKDVRELTKQINWKSLQDLIGK